MTSKPAKGTSVYFHQANQLAERSVGALASTLAVGGIKRARIKATQWLTWTGRWDSGPAWDIDSLDAVKRLRDEFLAVGITLEPWGVPMGLQSDGTSFITDERSARPEAERFANIANVCGFIDLDMEPYAEFCPPIVSRDYRFATPFFKVLRDLAPDATIVVDLPYRDNVWAGDENELMSPVIEYASPYVDGFFLQSYFGIPQAGDAEARAKQHTDKPVNHIGHTTQGGPGIRLRDMAQWAEDQGGEAFSVWVGQFMTLADYEDLAMYDFGGDDIPPSLVKWQEPGFANLARQGEIACDPQSIPYTDAHGNVYQDGSCGFAVWRKELNRNFFVSY